MLLAGHAIHRVVTLEFHYYKPLNISNVYPSLSPTVKSINATCEAYQILLDIYMSVCLSCHNMRRRNYVPTHAQGQFWAVKTDL